MDTISLLVVYVLIAYIPSIHNEYVHRTADRSTAVQHLWSLVYQYESNFIYKRWNAMTRKAKFQHIEKMFQTCPSFQWCINESVDIKLFETIQTEYNLKRGCIRIPLTEYNKECIKGRNGIWCCFRFMFAPKLINKKRSFLQGGICYIPVEDVFTYTFRTLFQQQHDKLQQIAISVTSYPQSETPKQMKHLLSTCNDIRIRIQQLFMTDEFKQKNTPEGPCTTQLTKETQKYTLFVKNRFQ